MRKLRTRMPVASGRELSHIAVGAAVTAKLITDAGVAQG